MPINPFLSMFLIEIFISGFEPGVFEPASAQARTY